MGRLPATIKALSGRTMVTFDASGLELTSTDELGVKTQDSYDGRGLLQSTMDGVGGNRSPLGFWENVTFDSVGRETGTTDALGDKTASLYDLAGQLTADRDAVGRWTKYAYNSRGWQTAVTDNAGNVTSSAYDKGGNLTSVTDPLSHTTSYGYDALNRQTTVTDPLNNKTTTTFDAVGDVSTETDAKGNVTSYAYDVLNRQTTLTYAAGSGVQEVLKSAYDAVGNVTASTDALGKTTTTSYDALYRATAVTDPLSHTTSTAYDAVGDLTSTTDPLNKTTTNTFDYLHRQTGSTDPLGHTSSSILNAEGDAAATVDALGNETLSIIDPLARNVGSVDALGDVTRDVLDAGGETALVIDPVGNQTSSRYDTLGRLTVATDASGGVTTTAYDSAGRVTLVTDPDGRTIAPSYDNANRETGEVWKSAAGATVNVVTYGYDAANNRTSAADTNGSVAYSFDALNRVQSYTNVWGQVLTYSYNADDNVTLRTDSLGGTLTSVYDNAQRLTSVQFSGTGPTGTVVRVDFGYDNRDERTSKTWYSDLAGTTKVAASAYGYDDAGRLTSIANQNSSLATLSAYTYTFDSADRVSNQSWWSKVGGTVYSGSNTYTYDSANQLLSDGTKTYSYDAGGNRTMSGYQTGTNNRLTNDGTYTYTFDAAGNVTQKVSATLTWTYSYDNHNHLTGATETGTGGTLVQETFTYDVEGRLVQQAETVSGTTTTTRFAVDAGGNSWADLDTSNNLLVRYLRDDSGALLTRTVGSGANAGVGVYLTDRLGSVRDIANWSAAVLDHLDYTGPGVLTESNSSVGDYNKYDSYHFISAVGMYLAGARTYDPSTGRWGQLDPIGFDAGQANLYQYVGNSPVNAVDSSGLAPAPVFSGPKTKTAKDVITFQALVDLPLKDAEAWLEKVQASPRPLRLSEIGALLRFVYRTNVTHRPVRIMVAGTTLPQEALLAGKALQQFENAPPPPALLAARYWPTLLSGSSKRVAQAIKDLDADEFAVRQKASSFTALKTETYQTFD
jgi:RHS repeat-associated protein